MTRSSFSLANDLSIRRLVFSSPSTVSQMKQLLYKPPEPLCCHSDGHVQSKSTQLLMGCREETAGKTYRGFWRIRTVWVEEAETEKGKFNL